MATNDILPFCPTDTGSNLLSESDYAASADRVSGNKPGIASSKLNNKAIRQAAFIASQYAQFISNQGGLDVLDDADDTKLLQQITSQTKKHAPSVTTLLSGTGNWNMTYKFFIASGSATVGATYTNNSVTYTVKKTVAAATFVEMTGNGDPSGGGTLTKTGGTGDATIVFYGSAKPIYVRIRAVGGGGGGGGGGLVSGFGTAGGNGVATTFGTTLISAGGGTGGANGTAGNGGPGGTASLGTGPVGVALTGGWGAVVIQSAPALGSGAINCGGIGGSSAFGGAGSGAASTVAGAAGVTNTGGGGGGGGTSSTPSASNAGSGGGSGAFVDAIINAPLSTYGYAVGTGGTAGTAGTQGGVGGAGGSGIVIVEEFYQ